MNNLGGYLVLDTVSFIPSSASQVYDFGYDSNLLPTHLMFALFEYIRLINLLVHFKHIPKITEEEVNYANTNLWLIQFATQN